MRFSRAFAIRLRPALGPRVDSSRALAIRPRSALGPPVDSSRALVTRLRSALGSPAGWSRAPAIRLPSKILACGASTLAFAVLAACVSVPPAPAAVTRVAPRAAGAAEAHLLATADAFRIPIENVDGALLFRAILQGSADADTTGLLVLDTGAGYLSLSQSVMRRLHLSDGPVAPMTFAPKPLARLTVGGWSQDVVGPVLGVDTEVIEEATDRHVLGLLGYEPLASFALEIDYRVDTLAFMPVRRDGVSATPATRNTAVDLAAASASFGLARNASHDALAAALGPAAIALPFEIAGDGKILVTASARSEHGEHPTPLTLVLDTGATKTVVFRSAFERARADHVWPELRGLSAPTLYGTENAYIARIPQLAVVGAGYTASADDVDVAVMESDLEGALKQAVGRPVDGLLGTSFLRRFRITIDYPHRILWLEPLPVGRDQRRYEYSHVGVQIERREGALRVVAVAEHSPAADAGIAPGDVIAGIDAAGAGGLDVVSASRRLEGPPGSHVTLRIRRGSEVKTYRLTRRSLL